MFSHYLAFIGSWVVGIIIMFFMLKNTNKSLKPGDILTTLVLSALLSVVFSFAAEKANLFHWFTCIGFAFLGGFVTYKFLDKEHQPKKFFAVNPMVAIPLINIFHSGGLWLIPLVLFAGSARCFWLAGKAAKSNSTQQRGLGSSGAHTVDNTGNVPVGSEDNKGYFVWGIMLFLCAVGSLIWIASDYKGV